MARGPKKHLKRLNAPKHWMLDKLTGRFVSRMLHGAVGHRMTRVVSRRVEHAQDVAAVVPFGGFLCRLLVLLTAMPRSFSWEMDLRTRCDCGIMWLWFSRGTLASCFAALFGTGTAPIHWPTQAARKPAAGHSPQTAPQVSVVGAMFLVL